MRTLPGLDPVDLLELGVRPALEAIGPTYATKAAEQLVLGAGAEESDGFKKLRQYNHGPALGLWQMEPFTFRDIRDRFLVGDASWKVQVRRGLGSLSAKMKPEPDELAWNLRLGAAYCRIRFLYTKEPLPQAGDVEALARYWKQHYNTPTGAGTVEKFVHFWNELIAPRERELWPK